MGRTTRRRRLPILLAVLGAGVLGLLQATPAQAATGYPVQPWLSSAALVAAANPDAPAPGMNLPDCQLTAAHPYPVVLVNATATVMGDDWGALAPVLANNGYCVEGLNYGGNAGQVVQAIGPVRDSAAKVAAFIDSVRAKYGVDQVDLVGHSQGGLIAEYVTKVLRYGPKVHALVALAPTTHGTTLGGLATLAQAFPLFNQVVVAGACGACYDQEIGSDVVAELNSGPVTVPGVQYTVIETRYESVVTPVGSSFIKEPGVRNQWVQDACWNDVIDHAGMPYSNTVNRMVLNALSPSTAKAPNCWLAYTWPAVDQ